MTEAVIESDARLVIGAYARRATSPHTLTNASDWIVEWIPCRRVPAGVRDAYPKMDVFPRCSTPAGRFSDALGKIAALIPAPLSIDAETDALVEIKTLTCRKINSRAVIELPEWIESLTEYLTAR